MSEGFRLVLDASALAKLEGMSREFIADKVLPQMVEKAKRIVPVDTGELQESIHQEVDGDGMRLVASSDHAVYIELGTVKMHAQPYLRPAAYTVLEGL